MALEPAAVGDPFDALADENRRRILTLLAERERPVHELAAQLPISRPAVSRHLRLLSEAGFVSEEREGTLRIYSLREEGVVAVGEYLQRVWGEAATRFRLMAENTEEPGTTE
ncbi:metalloregulator ArsR/SmtB family transcription factor [soil metagenome]